MDEEKQKSALSDTLRKISEQRDRLLGDVQAISPARRTILSDTLAREFAVEAALSKAAVRRDQLLNEHQLKIPHSVRKALQREATAAGPAPVVSRPSWFLDGRTFASGWLRLLEWPARAVVVTACLMITAGIVYFGNWESLLRGRAGAAVAQGSWSNRLKSDAGAMRDSALNKSEGLPPSDGRTPAARNQLSLRISAAELATLRASFLATSRSYFSEVGDESAGMRLDLPVRALLISDGVTRTP